MANYTKDLILKTFFDMLERMPFEKITITALIKECNIGRNTFYYHYEDIYDLLDDAYSQLLRRYEVCLQNDDLSEAIKTILYDCRKNREKVYHIYNSLTCERLISFIFDRTDSLILRYVMSIAEEFDADSDHADIVANVIKYSFYGFFARFLWNDMKDDIEENAEMLAFVYGELIESMLF